MRLLSPSIAVVSLLVVGGAQAGAQEVPSDLTVIATATNFPGIATYVDATFSSRLTVGSHPEELTAANVMLTTVPAGASLMVGTPALLPGSQRRIRVGFTGALPEAATQIQACFERMHFAALGGERLATHVCATADVINASNVHTQRAAVLGELKKVPKASADKNVFASGFITTGSDGSQGGGDINLNTPDLNISGLTTFAHLKKTSLDSTDPKNFEGGLNYRSTILFPRSRV